MGPLPVVAEEAGVRALRLKRIPTSIGPEDFFQDSDAVRRLFAGLVNAPDPRRVAIHPAASYGVATAARNFPLAAGQEVVVVGEQFPGNVYAWRRRADEVGARVRTVARPGGSTPGAAWNEALLEAIGPETGIVAVPTVHWTDGTRFDLAAVGAKARRFGAALLVDGTQSVGAVPFDVQEVQPDALVVAAYKWLLGPYALALTWLGPRFDDGVPLEETWIGRKGSEDFNGLVEYTDEYQPGAVRYDVGERSNFALLPVAVASLELLAGWTPARIADYVARLSAPLVARASALGFGVEDSTFRSPHLFGLRMPAGVGLDSVRAALQSRNVSVSLRGGSLRISPNVYNEEGDIRALTDALESVVR
jgi:selenocysteine lyase/cysteine desulfurase